MEIKPLSWRVTSCKGFTLLGFVINSPDGLLAPDSLAKILLPENLPRDQGLVYDGKGPVWLYAYLVHLAHTFAWTAVNDPRLRGAVVVSRHVPSAPELGSLVNIEGGR
jgi:CRISPR-associated protein Csx3